ncbi:MAG: hypothetical protein GYA12_10465 [Chloroflexi bacterium]|nr:hypothetical protein [Chloroflexota bacterium]
MDPSKSGLPAEIPLYTGAENFKGIAGIRMTFDVRDPMDTVKTFYKDAMRKASWSQIPGTENVPGAPLMFKKGDSTIIIQITEENGVTTVAITKAK